MKQEISTPSLFFINNYFVYFANLKGVEVSKGKTHITTNLNAEELEARYGSRVRSRLREMFNLIGFDEASTDKRK